MERDGARFHAPAMLASSGYTAPITTVYHGQKVSTKDETPALPSSLPFFVYGLLGLKGGKRGESEGLP